MTTNTIKITLSRIGGGPYCNSLAAATVTRDRLTTSTAVNLRINILDPTGFPPRGVVFVEDEAIEYRQLVINGANYSLENLTRGLYNTEIVAHDQGVPVVLEAPIYPIEGLVNSPSGFQINVNPDPVNTGLGSDGILHASFVETLDPDTGFPMVDPDTGSPISLWTLNTDTGTVLNPNGTVVLSAIASKTDPGLFSLTRFILDANVILRASGSKPLRMKVTEIVDIAGTLDLSGFPGEPLQFDVDQLEAPSPGQGGLPGPGGGEGGSGGTYSFLDEDYTNKDPSNALPVAAQMGGLPVDFPPEYDLSTGSGPPPGSPTGLETTRAQAGSHIREQESCGGTPTSPCTAGGGGGGGARTAGANGESRPAGSTTFGKGGGILGLDGFRFGGGLSLLGGQGGAGGGPSVEVSDSYKSGAAGSAVFPGVAEFAPGTGGGGGGGILHLAVQGAFIMRKTGSILARGGDAYQSIDLSGNGGAGGGGSVLIQLANSMSIEPGALIDVSGGVGNLPPPTNVGQTDPIYEGNIRRVGTTIRQYGGLGGAGAVGRVRIETIPGSNLLNTTFNDSLSSSVYMADAIQSVGYSKIFTPGVGPGNMALSPLIIPEIAILRFADQAIPEGTKAFLLWEGGEADLDVHGLAGYMHGMIEDVRNLPHNEYLRFSVQILSNGFTGESPTITEVELPYRLGNYSE